MIDSNVLLSRGEFFPALSLLEKGRSSRSASVQMDRIDLAAHPQPGLDELLRIHEYERQRLGQELHDSTGQLVVVLLLSLARLKVIEHDGASMHVIDDMQDIDRKSTRLNSSHLVISYAV